MTTVERAPMTAEQFYRMPESKVYELIKGQMVEREVSNKSSRIGVRIASRLDAYCDALRAGWVFGSDQGYQCFPGDPDRVRRGDASFIQARRMTQEEYDREGFCPIAPDLLVEVISPNDLMYDVEKKRDEWLNAGVKLVWIINPDRKTVWYHDHTGKEGMLRETDTLTAEPVLPGFSLPVAELFKLPV